MVGYIFIHKKKSHDDVSFLEAFLVGSILKKRNINICCSILQFMKAHCGSKTYAPPYGMFNKKILKAFHMNMRNGLVVVYMTLYDTYYKITLTWMHYKELPYVLWIPKLEG